MDQIKAAAGVPRNETAWASMGLTFFVSLIELCLVKLAWAVLGLPSFDAGKGFLDLWIGNIIVAPLLGTRFYRSREVARSARIASPGEFLIVTTAIASLLTLSGSTLLSLIFAAGIRVDPLPAQFVIGFVAGVSLFVAFILGDRFFLACGKSLSGSSVVTWDRLIAEEERFVAPSLAVEYGYDRQSLLVTSLLCHLFCLVVMFLLFLARPGMFGFFLAGAMIVASEISGFWWLSREGSIMRVDHGGVFGYPTGLPFTRKLVPWSEIASCDLITLYDPSGRVVCFVPVFKNQASEALLKLNLAQVPLIDQERIVRYIKMKLPVPRAAIDDAVGIAKKIATKDAGLDRGGRVLRRSEKSELSVGS